MFFAVSGAVLALTAARRAFSTSKQRFASNTQPVIAVLTSVTGLRTGLDAALAQLNESRARAGKSRIPYTLKYVNQAIDDVREAFADANVILGEPKLAGPHLSAAKAMLWYQSSFAGVEHVFRHTDRTDFVFTRMGEGMSAGIAEWTLLCILAHERQFSTILARQAEKKWAHSEVREYTRLSDRTLGILGAGTIGKHVASVARGLGMATIGFKRTPGPADGCDETTTSLDHVLASCDVVLNVLPSTPATAGLLSGGVLKAGAARKPLFLNAGRGDVIEDTSLLQALDNGWLSGAYLDVFTEEPLPASSPLWSHPKIVITPHVACVSFTSDVVRVFTDNFERLWDLGLFTNDAQSTSAAWRDSLRPKLRYAVNIEAKY
jgi:phosphoglycerate dehydrogenase-like enzyme